VCNRIFKDSNQGITDFSFVKSYYFNFFRVGGRRSDSETSLL